jgi:hypothetical protein
MRFDVALAVALMHALSCDRQRPEAERKLPAPPMASVVVGPELPEGEAAVQGVVNGNQFPEVAVAWEIESPDVRGATHVYLFSHPIRCTDLSFTGWDHVLEEGTVVVSVETFGSTPGDYLAVPDPGGSEREASVQWTGASRRHAPTSVVASGGWVTLRAVHAHASASGSIDVTFGTGRVTAQFNASFCFGGHEP